VNPALEYIHKSPQPYREIMMQLQLIIESAIPDIQLKYKWRMPFYYLDDQTMFCFLNYRKTYVDLGLTYGNRLSNKHGVLIDGANRKMLRSLKYASLEDINDVILIETLKELFKLRKSIKNNV
jgi:hypothetical protein